jgi:hypothetical protein
MNLLRTLFFASLVSCGGGEETGPTEIIVSTCGDIDGYDGGDTGNIPDVVGNWTSAFAYSISDDDCGLPLDPDDAFPFLNSPFEVAGAAPAGLRLEFNDKSINWLHGIESATGGIVFSGTGDSNYGELHIAVSGLLYEDSDLGRPTIEGMVILAIDTDSSGTIDCTVKGDWRAIYSG